MKFQITVKYSKKDGWFYAESETLHIYSEGTSLKKALMNFIDHYEHQKEHYSKLKENEAIGLAKKLKLYYDNLARVEK